jgi:MFS superfamily sulfate permease-like transporter
MLARPTEATPIGDADGFKRHLRHDLLSGFLVFLIALPLCLGISIASGYPPLAGIFTAIIGAIVTTFLSNSELTIKGPAAGLIVIAVGCITDFGGDGVNGGFSAVDQSAYRAALAVGVIAALLQIAFALFRAGILGEFFPTAVVHGMLAAIGVIIMIKQFPVALGVSGKGEPLEMLREFPKYVSEANPAIAAIGLVSVLIMFLWPAIKKRVPALAVVPGPIVVLAVAVAMGVGFDLMHKHSYTLNNHKYPLGEQYLVAMPKQVLGMFNEVTTPDFSALASLKSWKWVFMFFAVGSLETMLSAKAIDSIDPWKRKTDINRDLLAVGIANLGAAAVGGLPMISEIVRSKANIDNGARTRYANFWHGVFLLGCVALIPMFLHRIPLAALAAMLVYTGFRLAHPMEFVNAYRIGKEQLLIFAATVVGVLATDLLVGVLFGVLVKMGVHLANGVPLSAMFKPYLEVEEIDATASRIVARGSAVFSNWIPFRRQIEDIGLVQRRDLEIDLSQATLVDHSVMEKLEELRHDFEREGLKLTIEGLDSLKPFTSDPHAARKFTPYSWQRLTVILDSALQEDVEQVLLGLGATACHSVPCVGSFNRSTASGTPTCVRIEAIAAGDAIERMVAHVESAVLKSPGAIAYVEPVQIVRGSG